ncbi:MAG: hypothetical protein JST70_17020 [Bacteroidetes bacterium]|nr:hypothetical protein [Bacteroidota bacterium]
MMRLFLILFLITSTAQAQEEGELLYQGKRYLDLNIRSINKLNVRDQKLQQRLLNKLARKEHRYLQQLKRKDSVAYANLQQHGSSYDSIRTLSKNGTGTKRNGFSNSSIDSLQRIAAFLQSKSSVAGKINASEYNEQLQSAAAQANQNHYIWGLIEQRANNLKNTAKAGRQVTGMNKQLFYAREKMKVFKDISNGPSKAEDFALETLHGELGFEQCLHPNNSNSMASLAAKGASVSDLEKMGYPTKRQLTASLQQKFGNSLGGMQQKMGSQMQDYMSEMKKLQTARNAVRQTKTSLSALRKPKKPEFKINPMRGLPFAQRIEKQFNWQTSRSTLDGKPAMLQASVMAGFKHTPKLSYGIGIATSIGLGQNWNNLRLSFQGLGLRTYVNWQLVYGVGLYAGYERMYKQAAFLDTKQASNELIPTAHNTRSYNESILAGLTKAYNINSKWNGSIQILYDAWWKGKGLRSPIVLRFASIKK